MRKINWQNGTLVSKAKVTIDGTVYEVEPEEFDGQTPLSAENFNQMQNNAEDAIDAVQSNLNTTNQNISNLTTYSTNERVVGEWINGKTLYEKTLVGTKHSGTDLEIALPSNTEIAFIHSGYLKAEGDTIYALDRSESDGYYTRTEIYPHPDNNFVFKSNGPSPYFDGEVTAVVRYTKTTG